VGCFGIAWLAHEYHTLMNISMLLHKPFLKL
jgi:hypothetical protein